MDEVLLHWTVPATAAEIREVRRRVSEAATAHGADAEEVAGMALAVSEAVANAVMHAFPDRPAGTVGIELRAAPPDLQLVVWDDGVGMRVRSDSPGAGFGLTLIRGLADTVDVSPAPGGGVQVDMRFALSATGAPPEPAGGSDA